MPLWRFHFRARRKGAIGVIFDQVADREGETCDKAVTKLYDEFEHISVYKAELIPDKPKEKQP
jgi:hypothetical protein